MVRLHGDPEHFQRVTGGRGGTGMASGCRAAYLAPAELAAATGGSRAQGEAAAHPRRLLSPRLQGAEEEAHAPLEK